MVKMRLLLSGFLLLACLGVRQCSSKALEKTLPMDSLERLSLAGEQYVDGQLEEAMRGVRQMKEVMEENEEKHRSLMKSLRETTEETKADVKQAHGVEERLGKMDQHCQNLLRSSWEECRPCLEDVCRTFYTSNCRRGFSSFSLKVKDFFHRMMWRFDPQYSDQEVHEQSLEDAEAEATQMDDLFSQLMRRVESLYDRSRQLVARLHGHLDQAIQQALTSDTSQTPTLEPEGLDTGFIEAISLDGVLQSIYDFGRRVFQQFNSVIGKVFDSSREPEEGEMQATGGPPSPGRAQPHSQQLCRELHGRTSECWQLKGRCAACREPRLRECPGLGELQVQLSDISQLLELSRQRYQEAKQVVQRHAADTLDWISNMASSVGWVMGTVRNDTAKPENVFRVSKVLSRRQGGTSSPSRGTTVEVNILNSPTLTLNVPEGLEVQDPAFIQYVAQKALGMYKQMVKQDESQ